MVTMKAAQENDTERCMGDLESADLFIYNVCKIVHQIRGKY